MSELIFRTEELEDKQITDFYVSSEYEQNIVDKLKAPSPVLLVGSRGVGKSFLFKVSEIQLKRTFAESKILPVYVTLRSSPLIKDTTEEQFRYWIMARICAAVFRAVRKSGKISLLSNASFLSDCNVSLNTSEIDRVINEYEESWKGGERKISVEEIPNLDDFLDFIQDLCESFEIKRIVVFVDEAAHVFIPQQQRAFFTLFRDLRSPYIKCNATVYPGVTVYGDTFEPTHDAVVINLIRNIRENNYVSIMKEIVSRQVTDSKLLDNLSKNGENFSLLAYAASGNPRYLLKCVSMAEKMDSSAINKVFRDYFRGKIWAEHTKLADRFSGYKEFIEWGRDFLETEVIPKLRETNDKYLKDEVGKGTTLYFWVHKDAPIEVKESIRILEYSGLLYEDAEGIRATRSEVGTRYMVNIGCLLAAEAVPSTTGMDIIKKSDIRRMNEYGMTHASYKRLEGCMIKNGSSVLMQHLAKNIDKLDLTEWQKKKMHEISIDTIGDVIQAKESDLKKAKFIADVRAKKIRNAAVAAVYEYLLG
ncbi:hypothetical protein FZ041_06590 [Selenomonas caprae]|uniref:Uncharacterized protein n=1 Tax=Selenomonas caprae TaxID=2606905 RepID=A0A5D6WMD7_9FIRM|nr:hypothetical protein [Selenomonas caprae]TYZ28970.1 hypothetical protein FZ041_06590 [Selenomonas caprae]